MVNRARVLDEVSPYIFLFGVDQMGRGRPGIDSKAFSIMPQNDVPPMELVGTKENAIRIRKIASGRALTALKAIFAAEYKKIYRKEMLYLSMKQAEEDGRVVDERLLRVLGVHTPLVRRLRAVKDISSSESSVNA